MAVNAQPPNPERQASGTEGVSKQGFNRFEILFGERDDRWPRAAQADAQQIRMLERESALKPRNQMLPKGLMQPVIQGFAQQRKITTS